MKATSVTSRLANATLRRALLIFLVHLIRIDPSAIRKATKYDGKWVVQTNDDTISFEDAACGYKGLMVIGRCFRSLKRTQIKMTPMYHWAPSRIEAHVKICVFALLMERLSEISCGQSWSRIKHGLEVLQISYFSTTEHRFYRTNEPTAKVKKLLKSLKIPTPKLLQSIEKHTQNL